MKREVKRLQFGFSQEDLQRIDALQVATDEKSRTSVVKDAIRAYGKLLDVFPPDDIVEIVNKEGQLVFKGPARLLLPYDK